jgi:hypothetical protein
MEEEDSIVQQRVPRDCCYAYFTYREPGEFDFWIESSTTESLQAGFELLATEAGIALDLPAGTLPLTYWLHSLFLDLRANNSSFIRIYNDTGGFIDRVFEASANYCARLDRRTLEKAAMSYEDGEGVARQHGLREAHRGGDLDSAQSERTGGTLSKAEDAAMPAQELAVATTERTKMVDDFLVQCNRESVGFKVRRKHIWLAVGHARARQFQYWQEGSDKATDADDRAFRRILRMSPAEFIALLKKKGISPSSS